MLTHEHKGRLWQEVGREPYTRADGTKTELIRWRSPCAKCGEGFDVTTPSEGAFWKSDAFGAIHCQAHKLTKEQVTARWQEAIKAARGKK